MLKDQSLTYVSLFSCAGVGCHGFDMEGFHCVATAELNERRLNIQKFNKKCELESGYISGDLLDSSVKQRVYDEVDKWSKKGNDRVDVLVATPPCQGISVINHKKNVREIERNSLVVESAEIINHIKPRFFVFENVASFHKTLCIASDGKALPISEFIQRSLGQDYVISNRVLNFMNYGSNSSRTRNIFIGVAMEYRNSIAPYDLFPDYRENKTLREVIGSFEPLEWGEISSTDFYHAFRTYKPAMREWIHELKEGQSAFDNEDESKRPHRMVKGVRVENIRKNRDKYTRQIWDRFPQCIHTRNDQLAAQNTVHPEQDRVLSVREIMELMTVPHDFKWVNFSLDELNNMSASEKRKVYKANEMNIRQCLGEAVPTEVMRQIANKIKGYYLCNRRARPPLKKIISNHHLSNPDSLYEFLDENPLELGICDLINIVELCNLHREQNAAFYTSKFLVNEIMNELPDIPKDEIHILEPSVGAGSFLPLLFKRYESAPSVILDVVDIDPNSIVALKHLLGQMEIPSNFEVRLTCADFLAVEFPYRFDVTVGNPPFTKIDKKLPSTKKALAENINDETNSLAEIFLEKCLRISDFVSLVLDKTILSSGEYRKTRDWISRMRIQSIIDFGRHGFSGVSIETICLMVHPKKRPQRTHVRNVKHNFSSSQSQDYITDPRYPSFLIYRDEAFDKVAEKLQMGVFSVFRDRQITKRLTSGDKKDGSLWVLKAKNISDDGSGVRHIEGYDVYLDETTASSLSAYKYVGDKTVYLTPNMTYRPRIIENFDGVICDGSVAILIPKDEMALSTHQLAFFSSEEFRSYYKIARNLSTQSINVDRTSVFYYGVLRDDK